MANKATPMMTIICIYEGLHNEATGNRLQLNSLAEIGFKMRSYSKIETPKCIQKVLSASVDFVFDMNG